jgi:hypothetical protein
MHATVAGIRSPRQVENAGKDTFRCRIYASSSIALLEMRSQLVAIAAVSLRRDDSPSARGIARKSPPTKAELQTIY